MEKQFKNNKKISSKNLSPFTFHLSPQKAFTLAEVMVTMAVLGVLAAIAIPAVMKVKPDRNRVMFKKAYTTLEKVVSDTISNDLYYPADQVSSGGCNTGTMPAGTPCGFAYTAFTAAMGTFPAGVNDKFSYLLSQELNTVGPFTNPGAAAIVSTFTTSDGIDWYLTNSGFTLGTATYKNIGVDVNGAKAPNCAEVVGTIFTGACTANNTPDRFEFGVRYDGKITILGNLAQQYLQNPTINNK